MKAQVFRAFRTKLTESRFLRNWSILVGSNFLGQALGMLATIRIARELAPAGYGQYNVVLTVGGIGTTLAAIGMRNVVTRECARFPERSGEIFLSAFSAQVLMMTVVSIGVLGYGAFSVPGLPLLLSVAAIGVLVGQTSWELLEALTFGHQRMEFYAKIFLLGMLVWLVGVWSVPSAWLSFASVSVAFALLQILKSLGLGYTAGRAGYLQRRMSLQQWKTNVRSMVQQSLPFYWLAILTTSTSQLPILFLVQRSGEAEVGLYNIGYRLVHPLHLVVWNALLALYPDLSRASVHDKGRFMRIVRRSLIAATLLGTVGALVISLLRWEVVTLLFGSAYLPSADAMAFQVWYSVLYSLYCLMGVTMAAADKQVWMAWLATAYTAVAVPLQWWGAGYGATGLAMAVVAGSVVSLWYHWMTFQKSLPQAIPAGFTLALAGILVLGGVAAMLMPDHLPLLWRAGAALMLVVASAWWLLKQRTRSSAVAQPQTA